MFVTWLSLSVLSAAPLPVEPSSPTLGKVLYGLCAGHLLLKIREVSGASLELNDPGRAACALAEGVDVSADFLRGTAAGVSIEAVGLGDDLILCADVDRHDIVPQARDGSITLAEADPT